MSKFITDQEKGEFIRRCKTLARNRGTRIKYYPARWTHLPFDDLTIRWCPDEDYLRVSTRLPNRNPCNESWSKVIEEHRGRSEWGCTVTLRHHLELLRQMMVLDDLADV